ncbi:hypothetical protein [Nocardia cyriacigeorgica]
MSGNPAAARRFQDEFLAPRRASTASILDRGVARGSPP